jgi:hypothetical protein
MWPKIRHIIEIIVTLGSFILAVEKLVRLVFGLRKQDEV